MNNCFILLAAGKGKRFNSKEKKQFINYKNKPLFMHSIEKAKKSNLFKRIVLVTNKQIKIVNVNVIKGGKKRSDSSFKALKYFSNKGIRTNCTLIFSVGQALIAAKAGATYVSPFIGRLDDISTDGLNLISEISNVYDNYAFNTQILAASVRHTMHIIDCAKLGADVITGPLSAIKGLMKHPLTDIGLEKFLSDHRNNQ